MLFAEIRVTVREGDEELTDEDLEDIDIAEAVQALEEQLPELPKGAVWEVKY